MVKPKIVKYSVGGDEPDNSSPTAGDNRNKAKAGGTRNLREDNLKSTLPFALIILSTRMHFVFF